MAFTPGPKPRPILGTFPQVAKIGADKLHLFYKYLHGTYGPVARVYFGKYPLVLISGFDAVNEVFINQRDVMIERPDYIPGIKKNEHLKASMLFINGAPSAESRKTMLSAVSVILKSPRHEDLVLAEVQKLVKDFKDKEGAVFQPREHLNEACFSWCLGSNFGKRYDQNDAVYRMCLKGFLDILHNDGAFSPCGTVPLLKYIPYLNKSFKTCIAGYDGMKRAARSELEERKLCYDENRIECLVDVFIREQRKDEDNLTFSDDKIAVYVGDYLLGGVPTIANTLDWALLYMAAYPHIQEKCRQEIQQVCGDEGQVKFIHVDKLPYVRATVLETQRIASVVPISLPYCALKDINVRGYTIPKGTMIAGHFASVHMDDTQWTEPDKFNPDRFLDTDGKLAKKTPAFMPYGNGPRYCPGYSLAENELVLVFGNLLHSLEFTGSGKIHFDGKYTFGVHPLSNEVIATERVTAELITEYI